MRQAIFRALVTGCALLFAASASARLSGVAIGVSDYADPALSRAALPGAALDAETMRAALLARGAAADDIALLTGKAATAAAIRAAIERLVHEAAAGDRIVVYLSGHGAQVPAQPGDLGEPDGKDEVLLATDTGQWDEARGTLPGAITDNEFGGWIDALRARGASVWFVVDACSGGGLQRGGEGASARVLDPALLRLPPPYRGGRADPSGLADASPMSAGGKLVTFYAAPAGGIAWERPLADGAAAPVRRGVFTWSLLRALASLPADANFLTLAGAADRERRALGPPGGPALVGGDLDRPALFAGDGVNLLDHARAAPAAPVALRLAVGPDGATCGGDPDPAALAPVGAAPLRIAGCRRILVDLQSASATTLTLRPWYRDAAGGYVALAGASGVSVPPGRDARFGFTVTDRDPDTGAPLPAGAEYLLLLADDGGALVVPLATGK
jgi:hypothetical protein